MPPNQYTASALPAIMSGMALTEAAQPPKMAAKSPTEGTAMQTVVKLASTHGLEPSTADLDGWVVTEGTPSMKTWALHTSAAGDMVSGIWECTVGSYHATYTAYEYVVLIEGRITITPDGGEPVTVKAGDAFVVEPTFKGIWKIEENVRKHFDFRIK